MSVNPLDKNEHPRYRCPYGDRGVFLGNSGAVQCQVHGLLRDAEVVDREC